MDSQTMGRVVLLMGGVSSERDVSLMSGEGVLKALQSKGVDVTTFDPKNETLDKLESGHFDRAFIALHGRLGEDGTIQGVLNYLNLPYTGPGVTASAVSIDKETTKTLWRAAGIPVPRGVLLHPTSTDEELSRALTELGATGLVVKPARDGSSIGVTKLKEPTLASLREALTVAGSRCRDILVEEYIRGREFTVAILDGKALPIIEIKAPEGDYDFQNKYFGNAVSYDCPAKLTEKETAEVGTICEKAFAALGARGWSRIDVMQRPDGSFALLEINTSPGMTPHSLVPMAARAVGLEYADLCLKVLGLARVD
ncbi:D-alanine--D-alanine ligase [gut metagenome]|uniref:D-alanine--D-alanine ligase n=1 Tax=gut metagenome TaxID=749906 RepID=J9H169_9ZZZZ